LPTDKIIICCGYSGAKEQRHSIMIKAISELPAQIKEKLYLIFPMGYSSLPNYIKTIKNELEHTNLPYLLIDNYLSHEETSLLKIAADVYINIQTTDALSASMQEHILAKNIVLVGDWLPYDIFNEIDIFFLKTSLENLNKSILNLLQQIDIFRANCINNGEKIFKFNSWDSTINDWRNLYIEMCK
jgi:hypothetical protein